MKNNCSSNNRSSSTSNNGNLRTATVNIQKCLMVIAHSSSTFVA